MLWAREEEVANSLRAVHTKIQSSDLGYARWKITERQPGEQCALHTSRDTNRRFKLGESPQGGRCIRPDKQLRWSKIASRLFLFLLDWEVIKVIGYCAAPFERLGLCAFVTAWAKIA